MTDADRDDGPPPAVPPYDPRPPRPLEAAELRALTLVADALIGEGPAGPRPSQVSGWGASLDRALAARRDVFDPVLTLAVRLADAPAGGLRAALEELARTPESGFDELSTVVAGAYLLLPEVREAIGYPGQAHRPPQYDTAAEEIMDGILDPVLARGPVYRSVP